MFTVWYFLCFKEIIDIIVVQFRKQSGKASKRITKNNNFTLENDWVTRIAKERGCDKEVYQTHKEAFL